MNKKLPLALLMVGLCFSCNKPTNKDSVEKWKNEIRNAEQEFAEMVKEEGIPKAFLHYAADDAVLMRNNNLVIGKSSIREFYNKQVSNKVSLTWKPDFVDVAASGDLGYTYGKYVYSTTDSLGNTQKFEGVFHTVWKRQPDGQWRFVWD